MAKTQTYTPSDVGCYADGSRGIYLTDFVVEFANDHGASITHNCDDKVCEGRKGDEVEPIGILCHHDGIGSFLYCTFDSEYGDEATNYMNEHYPVQGCYWGFIDGDWGLWTDSDD